MQTEAEHSTASNEQSAFCSGIKNTRTGYDTAGRVSPSCWHFPCPVNLENHFVLTAIFFLYDYNCLLLVQGEPPRMSESDIANIQVC
ncbi:TPA: hypothetical protein MH650_01555 [Klebsiella pneumoniae]|nr:hypothetical protein [Klebsiella pneumoniae]HBX6265813.1 hypothetical protein [Klebsiella pneumoniae]HBX6282452.1 hypothetical protein [Klebsiella pneumoniae]